MARYGRDFDRNRMGGRGRPGREGGFRTQQGREEFEGIGGMRSDNWNEWGDFEGGEGWMGAGSPGYAGGDMPYPNVDYGREFGGRPRGRGRNRAGRGFGGGYGAGYVGRGFEGGGFEGGGFGGGYDTFRGERGGYGRGRGGSRGDMRVADIMTDNPECVTPDTPVSDVAQKMRELDVGIIPVVDSQDKRRLQGVVTDRDLTIRVLAEGRNGDAKVSECMTDDVETVNKNDRVREVLQVMRREQVRRVPVTDREGRLVGIVAQADLLVDYAEGDEDREREVEDTIERISEPAEPERGRGRSRR